MKTVSQSRLSKISRVLLANRSTDIRDWYWISDSRLKTLNMKRANKYLLACSLDYQSDSGLVWDKAKWLAEEELDDPERLWDSITAVPFEDWHQRFKKYRTHRFPVAHDRLWRIGERIVRDYAGDARRIWSGRSAADATRALIEVGVGPVLSRMAVGGLYDCGWIDGKCDVKPDIHVKRVIGRVFLGRPATEDEVVELTRKVYPENPWRLDSALWRAGHDYCRPNNTSCHKCFLSGLCSFERQ